MKAAEIIQRFDEDRKNTISTDRKLRWLEEVERLVVEETIKTHVLPKHLREVDWDTYFDGWGPDSDMLVPPPWDQVYIHYLDLNMAMAQRETKFINMATTQYNNAMLSFTGWYNRNNRPLHKPFRWLRHETL